MGKQPQDRVQPLTGRSQKPQLFGQDTIHSVAEGFFLPKRADNPLRLKIYKIVPVFPIKWLRKIPSKEWESPPCFSCAIFSHAIPEARHEIRETLCWYHLVSHSPSNSEHKKHNIRTSCAFSLAPAYVFVVKKKKN